jgi:hypothetical protein
VASFLRDLIVARMSDLLGTLGVSLLDLPARFDEIAAGTRAKVAEEFTKYGLELVDLFINSVTPPEEVQQAIDARASMGAIGDLRGYTMYQAATGVRKMAESSEGGSVGGPMQVGLGAGLGMMLPGFVQKAMAQPADETRSPSEREASAPHYAPQAKAPPFERGDAQGLVRQIADSSGWTIDQSDAVWKLRVPIGPLRQQVVTVRFDRHDSNGHPVISMSSPCGVATEETAMALLRYNRQLVHAAFAIESGESGEMIVLQANQLTDTADLLEVTRALTAIAWQADETERQLLGEDQF